MSLAALGKILAGQQWKQVMDRFDGIVDCLYLGPGQQVMKDVLARAKGALEVRNTFVLFNIGEKEAYSTTNYRESATIISEFLNNGGSWTDILSENVTGSKEWLGFKENLKPGSHDRYLLRRQAVPYPIVNFMIIRYKGDKEDAEEVVFGWGHHVEDPTGRVFLSRNGRLISTFDNYWKMLKRDSFEEPSARVTPHRIRGMWFRVSYYVEYDRRAREGPNRGERLQDLHDAALVLVDFDYANRTVSVAGHRYRQYPGEGWARTTGFTAKSTDLQDNRLWFSTTSASDDDLHIAGWYRFGPKDHNDGYSAAATRPPVSPDPPGPRRPEGSESAATPETAPSTHPNGPVALPVEEFYGEFVDYKAVHANGDKDVPSASSSQSGPHWRPFNRSLGRLLIYGWKLPELKDFPATAQEGQRIVEENVREWEQRRRKTWPESPPPESPNPQTSSMSVPPTAPGTAEPASPGNAPRPPGNPRS